MLGVGAGAVPYSVLLYMIPLCYALTKKWFVSRKALVERKA